MQAGDKLPSHVKLPVLLRSCTGPSSCKPLWGATAVSIATLLRSDMLQVSASRAKPCNFICTCARHPSELRCQVYGNTAPDSCCQLPRFRQHTTWTVFLRAASDWIHSLKALQAPTKPSAIGASAVPTCPRCRVVRRLPGPPLGVQRAPGGSLLRQRKRVALRRSPMMCLRRKIRQMR